jgi:hypothetical protein
MATYTWSTNSNGNWETNSNWTPNTDYPHVTGDIAQLSRTASAPITTTLSSTIALTTLLIGSTSSGSTNVNFSVNGTGTIQFDSSGFLRRGYTASGRLSDVNVVVRSASNLPLKVIGLVGSSPTSSSITNSLLVNLKNPLNSIYQITRSSGLNIGIAFDSAEALGIYHPTYIFDQNTYINGTTTQLEYTGATSTYVNKSIWDISLGTPYSGRHFFCLSSTGGGLFKIGRSGQTFTIGNPAYTVGSAVILHSTSVGTSSDSNEFKEAIYLQTASGNLVIEKGGEGRWILSGGATVLNPSTSRLVAFYIYQGILQIPIDKVTIVTGSTAKPFYLGSSSYTTSATLELSGTGTVSMQDITFAKRLYNGANGLGVFRTVSGANVTLTSSGSVSTQNFTKVSTELNSTLNVEYLSIFADIASPNFYVGGEGVCVLSKSFTSPLTGYSLIKQDSGTLKITTSDKAATVQYVVDEGKLWVDGNNRIAAGTLVQVNNTATLQTTVTAGNAINVKALTLAAGSTVMVGGT